MFTTPASIALVKICATFAVMLFIMRRNWGLWVAIGIGGLMLGLLFGMSLPAICMTALKTLPQPSFVTLFLVVAFIMLLSEVQGKSGQGQRLVTGLSPYMKSPKLRLIFFPALVGLLPMPGGAIFSCPMVRDVSENLDISERDKVLINYWFRHIWESAWPLYPGYILACSLANIPPSLLWRYTFPYVIISAGIGWLFLLRHPIKALPGHEDDAIVKQPLFTVLLEALPIVVAIGGAFAIDFIVSVAGVRLPGGSSFVFSFLAAAITAIVQNKMPLVEAAKLMMKPKVTKMRAVILMIFMFKEIVIAAGVVEALATLISDRSAMLGLFFFLPIMMGALTGLMMGFVGAALPLLVGLLVQAGLYEERLCWIMVSLAAGHFGQMITPLHSCYLVSIEYFRVSFGATWRDVFIPGIVQLGITCAYVAALFFLVNPRI